MPICRKPDWCRVSPTASGAYVVESRREPGRDDLRGRQHAYRHLLRDDPPSIASSDLLTHRPAVRRRRLTRIRGTVPIVCCCRPAIVGRPSRQPAARGDDEHIDAGGYRTWKHEAATPKSCGRPRQDVFDSVRLRTGATIHAAQNLYPVRDRQDVSCLKLRAMSPRRHRISICRPRNTADQTGSPAHVPTESRALPDGTDHGGE